jgi:glycosyltransferase involved in cell wall biosynthesis
MTQDGLDIALVHHLPAAGGAPRVMAEYVARRPQHRFTVYTRMPAAPPGTALVTLPDDIVVRRFPLEEATTRIGRLRALRGLPEKGRELAAVIDEARHDVVFAHASTLVQSHEVLPYVRTPAAAYAPEALRSAYESAPAFGRPTGLRAALVRAGLDPFERTRRRIDRANIRAADQVVTHSRFTAGSLRRSYGVNAEVVELGVDADAFAGPQANRDRSVLSVGALHPLKGHQFVIEAVATIPRERRPNVVVVGDRGELASALERLARDHDVTMDLRQSIPFTELVGCYRRAGVLACGQLREPFGLVTLEGMAAGAPVVAVAEGGFVETVRDGETGLLVPRDASAFGAALTKVLEDDALAARLAAVALEDVRTRWTWERTAAGYDRLLARVADSSA